MKVEGFYNSIGPRSNWDRILSKYSLDKSVKPVQEFTKSVIKTSI